MAKSEEKKIPVSRKAPEGYAFAQRNAIGLDESSSLLQLIPCILFSCFVILLVRMETYHRPMSQFYWSSDTDTTGITDFFSLLKSEAIMVIGAVAVLVIIFRLISETLAVKRSWFYIPMAVYSAFVIISYFASDYKEFALMGYNDRFEGTLPLLVYMLMLFLTINSINTEKNVRTVLLPLAVITVLLSLLGISQAMDHDFFQTVVGQKLITPNVVTSSGATTWEAIEQAADQGKQYLNFTFRNRQIYQTVYNINYVSFYLTLLLPLFSMLFIRAFDRKSKENVRKVAALGIIIALVLYNLIGSASSGGYLGIGFMGIVAIILFNKQILKWWKPLLVIFVIAGIVMGVTFSRWWPELSGAFKKTVGSAGSRTATVTEVENPAEADPASVKPIIDYFKTGDGKVDTSINGNPISILWLKGEDGGFSGLEVHDENDEALALVPIDGENSYAFTDGRFRPYAKIGLSTDSDGNYLAVLSVKDYNFNFVDRDGHVYYRNPLGYYIDLEPIERAGLFKDRPNFGSGRGTIWSHSVPLARKHLIVGVGPDCYCLAYPHNDYAYKYSNGSVSNILQIVDKPHNMYLHMAICTGGISLLAILALYLGYMVQSFRKKKKKDLKHDYLSFAGAGIFLGITGFVVTGLVDDSTVSVMPMFYTLLGMGIAVNMILKRQRS